MKMIGMFKGLLLAGLIASLASMANGQSNGRWIGRTQISPSTATQSPAGVDGVRGDAEAQTNQGADQVALSSKKPTIVGSWVLTVSVPGNAPPFDSFKALWSLTGDGLLIAAAQGDIAPTPFPTSTSQHGAWAQTGGRKFAATFVSILYDGQTGDNLGSFRLRQSIVLNDAGDEWNGPFKVNVFDPDGNVVAVIDGTAHAKRIIVDPLD